MPTVQLYARRLVRDVETTPIGMSMVERMCGIIGEQEAERATPLASETVYSFEHGKDVWSISVGRTRQP